MNTDEVITECHDYVVRQRENDLKVIFKDEKIKPQDTRKFLENALRDGEIKTAGIDIDKLMPPVSRFGGGSRAKKQGVIDKLKTFFDKYFGIGGSNSFKEQEYETVEYSVEEKSELLKVAESRNDNN
ncbi:type I restriction endonuclease subunit R, EcoR124 family [Acetobacterium sp. UBA5834]|jgi:type I restriction enzyme R subunit|uniref:type I restriction endonuclease subunit R, EcoR124 family n=1 Tax=Acetobacterium sp. UBA5834 TaxID=1945907 RepID=UPI0032E4B6DC